MKLKRQGLLKDIGVSNFTISHLQQLLPESEGEKPVLNQVEWHPYCHDPALFQFCEKQGILLQAYSSLGGTDNQDLIKDVTIKVIAEKLGKKPAQVSKFIRFRIKFLIN